MVSGTVFLRVKGLLFKKEGATLTEILISVTVVALLAVLLLYAFQPKTQIIRSQDARRKADISKLQNILEDYYNDHNCYPNDLNDLVPDYISPLLRDPETGELYEYYPQGCDIYRIYVVLGYTEDPDIIEAGCELGCGPVTAEGQNCQFNYGVCSSNASLESCAECTGVWFACQGNLCNNYGGKRPDCKYGRPYCNDPTCGGGICGPCTACCDNCTMTDCL